MKALLLTFYIILSGMLFAQVKSFTLKDAVSGKNISLSDYNNAKGLVIIFTSNTCPFDQYYATRISELSQFEIPVLLVNAGQGPGEDEQAMKARASEAGWTYPYLEDKQQVLVQNLGATKTPQAFLLKRDQQKFSVVYSGVLDDNPQVATDVGNAYLKDAIGALLSGRPVKTPQTRPIGCSLRTGR